MKSVFLFLALIAITQSSELQELSNTDVEPVVNLDADKTEVAAAPEHDDIGEGQFGGGGFGGALLTTGSFTMMAASGGFEEEAFRAPCSSQGRSHRSFFRDEPSRRQGGLASRLGTEHPFSQSCTVCVPIVLSLLISSDSVTQLSSAHDDKKK